MKLRALENNDLEFLFEVENDRANWFVSDTKYPFSKEILSQYIASAQNIHSVGQIRFVLEENKVAIGMVDLFEFDSLNSRAGVGIFVAEKFRRKGIAIEALRLIEDYCKTSLFLSQIWCNIQSENTKSILLFEKQGYQRTGVKKNWMKTPNGYEDVYFYQKFI